MPKKNLLIAGAVAILLLIGAGYLIMSKTSKKSVSESTVGQGKAQDTGSASTKGSIRSLLSAGKNVFCTVTYPDNGGSGTMYIADKKMRGDFSTKDANGKPIESHMMQDGEFTYSWMGTQGFKMKIDTTVQASPTTTSGTTQQGADLDKQVDMNCSSWSVDNSKFTVPEDVKFIDGSSFMKQTQSQTQTQTQTNTNSTCAQISDPSAKAACMSAVQSGGY